MKPKLFSILLLLFAAVVSSLEVHAATTTLFGGGNDSRQLYSIDLVTGIRTSKWSPPRFPINGLTYNSSDGYLYATIVTQQTSGQPIRYIKINPFDFTVSSVLSFSGITLGLSEQVDSLEYDSRRNGFWATSQVRQELIFIDAASGQAQTVGQFASADQAIIGGIAYDPISDILYGMKDPFGVGGTSLVTIDRSTLALTAIGQPGLGFGFRDMDSLALNPLDGMLYSINDDGTFQFQHTGQLVRIDPLTGVASLLGNPTNTVETYQGLAFVTVPEPRSVHLIVPAAIAIIAGFSIRTRRFIRTGVMHRSSCA